MNNFDYQLVDLHLHSHHSRHAGEKQTPKSAYSADYYLTQLKRHNVGAFSFTDHDIFSDKFYLELKGLIERIKDRKIAIFPGVEFRILSTNPKADCNFIFNNNLDLERLNELKLLVRRLQNKLGANLNLLVKEFKKAQFDFFIIPDVGKSGKCSFEDFEDVLDVVRYVEVNEGNEKRLSKAIKDRLNVDYKQVFFSDCHDIKKYDKMASKTKINIAKDQLITFEDLKTQLYL
ncbi:hypothetical protein H3143_01245 [Mycoplasma tullyi]|uniref:PHP domain-containing protein n=1 Tax=Mycoplasma tullyi TaxID=1612150 RepID=A0A7D7UAV8_9MOLU|nr:hypothetical protein [Mycoplasma tullyi]QMT98744.1 hypothetical protein H3143_01245 [Mycoplasma tullyi]